MKHRRSTMDYLTWAIGGTVLLSALSHVRLFSILWHDSHSYPKVLTVAFFLSAVCGAAGLFRKKSWGFYFVYMYILVATLFFAVSVIPFLLGLWALPAETATILLISLNLAVFATAAAIHLKRCKNHYRQTQGEKQPE